MKTTTIKTKFKQWQVLPALSRPQGEATLPESGAAESAASSVAKPVRTERTGRSSQVGELQGAGKPPEDTSPPRASQRP